MDNDTLKGIQRVGADFFGGPIDAIHTAINPLIPADWQVPLKNTVGSSEWIADKFGIGGESPEYKKARATANLGLLAVMGPGSMMAMRNAGPGVGALSSWLRLKLPFGEMPPPTPFHAVHRMQAAHPAATESLMKTTAGYFVPPMSLPDVRVNHTAALVDALQQIENR